MTPFHDQIVQSFPEQAQDLRGEINYRNLLSRLENILKPQLENDIPKIFPEYTPHNWSNHILALFEIAAQLFGSDTLLRLNDVDRFLLVVGLYCHDWGMAMGDVERSAILEEFAALPQSPSDSLSTSDEMRQLVAFAKKNGVQRDATGSYPALENNDLPYWREYVRSTHAWRSGERVRTFLSDFDVDGALGESARDICIGHWLNYDGFRDEKQFRPLRMVATLRAHVRLVALVVRLTDLFDIGRDRTPYALRRFIGPADSDSIREWDKHEALDHIDCAEVGTNRWQVIIRGTCKQAGLWPSLIDLRDYLRDQLEQGVGLLLEESRIHHLYLEDQHTAGTTRFSCLDATLRWELIAEGFKPSNIRFEFDRKAIFQILSQEIYGEKPHVFIRELLQNAIDATHQLCARLKNHSPGDNRAEEDFFIHFKAEQLVNGRVAITCRDFGIGMDEHIVSNYLARIGSSYYMSDEHANEHLKLDAISRFGIGFLSCFIVTDHVTVKSRKLSKYGGDNEGVLVTIPSIDRHFEIANFSDNVWEGTSVHLEVHPEKISWLLARDQTKESAFKITKYLKEIAGFVGIPIFVEEGASRVLILHPNLDRSYRPRGVPFDVEVSQQQGRYRWTDELQKFRMCPDPSYLSDYHVDLKKDLKLANIEGFVTFPIPCSPQGDIEFRDNGILQSETLIITGTDAREIPSVVAATLGSAVKFKSPNETDGFFPSTLVYQNGIYVTGEGQIGQQIGDDPFPAHAWINYHSESRAPLTVARTGFTSPPKDPKETPDWIVIRARTHAFRKEAQIALSLSPLQRLQRLVQLEKFFGVSNGSVVEAIPWNEFPVLILNSTGQFQCVAAKDAFLGRFCVMPEPLQEPAYAKLAFDVLDQKEDRAKGYAGPHGSFGLH